jgi:hypothetical protein
MNETGQWVPAGAATPSDIPAHGWKDILWRLYERLGEDRILTIADLSRQHRRAAQADEHARRHMADTVGEPAD